MFHDSVSFTMETRLWDGVQHVKKLKQSVKRDWIYNGIMQRKLILVYLRERI